VIAGCRLLQKSRHMSSVLLTCAALGGKRDHAACKSQAIRGTTCRMRKAIACRPEASVHAPVPMNQDEAYLAAARLHGAAIARLARGYERDPARCQDLLQAIHVALWRSFGSFDGRCSLRTWVYRVAHNIAIKHLVADRRQSFRELRSLAELDELPDQQGGSSLPEDQDSLRLMYDLIETLRPADRQVILLYLEELTAEAIGEVVGLSQQNVATKIHRIKRLLASRLHPRGSS
jgi:RNA polymerase sigma-70 factor, ECF subfamily